MFWRVRVRVHGGGGVGVGEWWCVKDLFSLEFCTTYYLNHKIGNARVLRPF